MQSVFSYESILFRGDIFYNWLLFRISVGEGVNATTNQLLESVPSCYINCYMIYIYIFMQSIQR